MRTRMLVPAVVAAACFACPAPARGQDAAAVAVVKKAIEAHGGAAALDKSKTARSKTKGTMTVFGQDIEFVATAVYSVPDKFKLEMAAEIRGIKMVATQLVNGKVTKVKTVFAGTEQPVDDKVKDETAQAVLLQEATTLTPLVDGKKFTIKAEADGVVDEKPAAVVLVTGGGLKDVRLFFDKTSGLLVKTQRKGLSTTEKGVVEVVEESYLSDYKKTGNALLPTTVKVTHDGKKFMTATVTETVFLDKVDAADFAAEK